MIKLLEKRLQVFNTLSKNEELIKTKIIPLFIKTIKNKGMIYTCGNGGSAADALHLSTELVVRYKKDKLPIRCTCLNTNCCHLTAISNDYTSNQIFSRQILNIANAKDLLIVYTTSGTSKNIEHIVSTAYKQKTPIISFLGNKKECLVSEYSRFCMNISSDETPIIQECHTILNHIICEYLEEDQWIIKNVLI